MKTEPELSAAVLDKRKGLAAIAYLRAVRALEAANVDARLAEDAVAVARAYVQLTKDLAETFGLLAETESLLATTAGRLDGHNRINNE